jgi:hypothetical protein
VIGSRWTGLPAALTLILASALTLANAAHPQTASSQGLEIRKVEAVYLDDLLPAPGGERRVELFLRAETRNGDPLELRPDQVVIRDEGELVDTDDIELTRHSDTGRGALVVLAIDTSRTMKGEAFERAKAAGLEFMDRMGSFDRVALVAISDQVEVVAPFEQARASTKVQLEQLEVDSESLSTVLFDGIHKAIELTRSDSTGGRRCFVIVFSDGKDSGSIHSLQEIIEYGQGNEAQPRTPVFTIGYARFGGGGLSALEELSRGTAATAFHATSADQMASFFDQIWLKMMRSYVVSFAARLDGEHHTVVVSIDGATDRRSADYPDKGAPVWPWLVAVVLLAAACAGAWFFARSYRAGRLIYTEGPHTGESVSLWGSRVRIGALDENDVVIDSNSVSRYHAQIRHNGGRAEIEDLGSSNGTFVNGVPVHGVQPLRAGDRLRFGDVDMVYQR